MISWTHVRRPLLKSGYREYNNTIWQSKFSATEQYFFNRVITTSCAFSPSKNKSPHCTLVKICTSGGGTLPLAHCWNAPSTFSLCYIHCLVSINDQQTSVNINGCNFFLHGGIQWHITDSYALPFWIPLCQTAPFLPSVAQQQNVTEYWWEGSTLLPYVWLRD